MARVNFVSQRKKNVFCSIRPAQSYFKFWRIFCRVQIFEMMFNQFVKLKFLNCSKNDYRVIWNAFQRIWNKTFEKRQKWFKTNFFTVFDSILKTMLVIFDVDETRTKKLFFSIKFGAHFFCVRISWFQICDFNRKSCWITDSTFPPIFVKNSNIFVKIMQIFIFFFINFKIKSFFLTNQNSEKKILNKFWQTWF